MGLKDIANGQEFLSSEREMSALSFGGSPLVLLLLGSLSLEVCSLLGRDL